MATYQGEPEKISKVKWTCDICKEGKEYLEDTSYVVGNYYERICTECYDRGLLWSIKEAYKWRGQIKLDALKEKRDNE